jgi:beta-lactamase regulating signal transducer with metallopeptidase domain
MVVVEDCVPDAYALPGIAGRIVVTTAMLEALTPAERRVLLAHEASHLRHHHYLYLLLADVSAAANPLLRTTAAAVHLGVERWADDDAATDVADRQLAARAVARAALARAAHPVGSRPATALLMAAGPVVDRTRALLSPPPRPRRLVAVVLVALMLGTAASAVAVERITEKQFERAQADWHR